MNTLKIALVAAVAVALPVIGCAAADVQEETPTVKTEENVDPSLYTGAIIGSSGKIQQVNPGTYPPPGNPPISCGSCYKDSTGTGCYCPHGFGTKSGIVCPYGQHFVCFATYCSCYY